MAGGIGFDFVIGGRSGPVNHGKGSKIGITQAKAHDRRAVSGSFANAVDQRPCQFQVVLLNGCLSPPQQDVRESVHPVVFTV